MEGVKCDVLDELTYAYCLEKCYEEGYGYRCPSIICSRSPPIPAPTG